MNVAIVVFDGFDELSAFVALGLLNRSAEHGWRAQLAAPSAQVTSMGGVTVQAQQPLEFANEADAVLFAGGLYSRAIAEASGTQGALLDRLQLDPLRQWLGAQCSGALLLGRLGLLADMPVCTDAATRPWLVQSGIRVEDGAFRARGSVATAGGPMAAPLLAAWLMLRAAGPEAALAALQQSAPSGERERWAQAVLDTVRPFLPDEAGRR